MITVLTGGTGGAKLVDGLRQILPARNLTVIVNTGDDLIWWGLNVSPDVDSIVYVLAGLLSKDRGWGVEADSFHCLESMRRLGEPAWFGLGDRDIAMHLVRTQLRLSGKTLTEVTAEVCRRFGIESTVLPMTDDSLETRILTSAGELSFEEYFVRERYQVPVEAVRYDGIAGVRPAPGVLESIAHADAVLIAPSNPITSIGPILAVDGIREALSETPAPVVAISPVIGDTAVSGPAGELMRSQGLPVSVLGVARCYREFLDVLVIDDRDAAAASALESMGLRPVITNILMKSAGDKLRLAKTALECCILVSGAPPAAASCIP